MRSEDRVAVRRRKLLLHLSSLFPVLPLHSKKEREREKAEKKEKKRVNKYAHDSSRPSRTQQTHSSVSPIPSLTQRRPLRTTSSSSPPTSLSLSSHIPPARYYRVHDSVSAALLNQLQTFDDEKVSTALGYAALMLALTSKYYALPLRYRIGFKVQSERHMGRV